MMPQNGTHGQLGVFDSGFGGLTVLKPIHDRLPTLSTLYLGDNARAPYGVRSQEEILAFTLQGVEFLFEAGCPLVVLACNTASSQALRRIQQEILPMSWPDRRVLGVIRPAAEYLSTHGRNIGILGTPATVESEAYVRELPDPALSIIQLACPGLTDLIEKGLHQNENTSQLVKHFVDELLAKNPAIEEILLACTHYPLVYELFRKHVPERIQIVSQGSIVADRLADYLVRHPEIDARLDKTGIRRYLTTNGTDISTLASMFYGSPVQFEKTPGGVLRSV